MIPAFPKLFAIGTVYIQDIFNGPVEVSEKIDGSQFAFGKVNGALQMRSKGAELYADNPEKMFSKAIEHVVSIQDKLLEGMVFYAEYLRSPRHNILKYDRVPTNHLMLFGAYNSVADFWHRGRGLEVIADELGIELVPRIGDGVILLGAGSMAQLLDRDSVLGGCKIEGVVVKNYYRPVVLGNTVLPIMGGKYVSEAFKETHGKRWSKEETKTGRMDKFYDSFRTEARWLKAVQYLRDSGQLLQEPKDIGALMKRIHQDIDDEEMENIKRWLWREFGSQVKRKATQGMAEWYKEQLLLGTFK